MNLSKYIDINNYALQDLEMVDTNGDSVRALDNSYVCFSDGFIVAMNQVTVINGESNCSRQVTVDIIVR